MKMIRYQNEKSPRLFNDRWDIWNDFDQLLGLVAVPPAGALGSNLMDRSEDADNHYLRFEIPGLKKNELSLTLQENVLTMKGERRTWKNGNEEALSVEQWIRVPTGIKTDKIEAGYEDGILTVRLPKAEEVKPKQIEIKVK